MTPGIDQLGQCVVTYNEHGQMLFLSVVVDSDLCPTRYSCSHCVEVLGEHS